MPRCHSAGFSARPKSEWDLALNRLIHSAVWDGFVDPAAAYNLLGLHVIALVLPPPLAKWLAKWKPPQVDRAIACILIDAAGVDGHHANGEEWTYALHGQLPSQELRPDAAPTSPMGLTQRASEHSSVSSADFESTTLQPQVEAITKDKGHVSSPGSQTTFTPDDEDLMLALVEAPATPPLSALIHGLSDEQRAHPCPALPFVTQASKELDDLLQQLAGDHLWSIQVHFVALHPRRVAAPGAPQQFPQDDVHMASPRSRTACLSTDLELEPNCDPIHAMAACSEGGHVVKIKGSHSRAGWRPHALTSQAVYQLYMQWLTYYSHVSKIGTHPRQALYNFGRVVASGEEKLLWERVNTVLEIARFSEMPGKGFVCTPFCHQPSPSTSSGQNGALKADTQGLSFLAANATNLQGYVSSMRRGRSSSPVVPAYHTLSQTNRAPASQPKRCSCLSGIGCTCHANTARQKIAHVRKESSPRGIEGRSSASQRSKRRNCRRLMQLLPADVLNDVLLPKIVAAHTDYT